MKAEEIISKFGLNQSTWTAKGFHGILHTMFPVAEVGPLFETYFGDSVQNTLVFLKNNFGHWYWRDTDMRRLREKFIAKAQKNPKYVDQHLKAWKTKLKIFDQKMAKVDRTNLKALSDEKLLALYDEFYAAYLQEFTIAMNVEDAFSMYSSEFLEPSVLSYLKKIGEEKHFAQYYAVLMAPTVDSFVNEELKDRLKILQQIQKKPELLAAFSKTVSDALQLLSKFRSIEKAIEKHTKKHFFVNNNYAVQVRLDKKKVVEGIVELIREKKDPKIELSEMKNRSMANAREKKKLMQQIGLPAELRVLVKITEVFTFIQDTRKKYVLISNQYQRDFFEEVGRRLGIPVVEMEYSVYPELKDMLLGKRIDRKKLQERKRHSVIIHTKNSWHVFEGLEVDRLFERLFSLDKAASEVRGVCASTGKATGRVRIVLKIHDFINMQDGDILVTSMTRPEFVPVMKKAAAIITDEGGITSHAAIVSRELGVPCVIGTKIATKVLKDGEMVEVDATKGIVKLLSKRK